jgi:hypothetical protein
VVLLCYRVQTQVDCCSDEKDADCLARIRPGSQGQEAEKNPEFRTEPSAEVFHEHKTSSSKFNLAVPILLEIDPLQKQTPVSQVNIQMQACQSMALAGSTSALLEPKQSISD